MKDARTAPPPEMKTVPLPARAMPQKGSPRAQVVIQEFSDFQCPFCAQVQPTLAQIIETYGTSVKIVFRHKPLAMHQDAELASEAAVEAFRQKGSPGFWKMHDLMFKNQSAPDGLKTAALEKYAVEAGLDVAAFRSALAQRRHQQTVEDDSKACDDAGIGGTPAFVINGYFVSGAQPFVKFKKVIDRALLDAKKK
jgi:protein-disulfide isomerase